MTEQYDDLADKAYELFLDLASDNLNEANIELFNTRFPEQGGIGECEPEDDWADEIQAEVIPTEWREIRIGLIDQDELFSYLFARILISTDPENQECHILWQPE